jgi:hypothetical protein
MLLAPLPFDYVTLLDSGDRVRRTRKATIGSRVRRTSAATSTR